MFIFHSLYLVEQKKDLNVWQITYSGICGMTFSRIKLWRQKTWRGLTIPLSFLHLNFTITDSISFRRWQACKSSGLTLCSVHEVLCRCSLHRWLMERQGLPPPALADGTGHLYQYFCPTEQLSHLIIYCSFLQ